MLLLDEFGHDASVLCLDYDMSERANGKKRENGGATVIVAMNDEEVREFIHFYAKLAIPSIMTHISKYRLTLSRRSENRERSWKSERVGPFL